MKTPNSNYNTQIDPSALWQQGFRQTWLFITVVLGLSFVSCGYKTTKLPGASYN